MGISLPESSLRILEYTTARKKKEREYQARPEQKFRRKKKEHKKMKEEKKKDEKSRASYGKRLLKKDIPRTRCDVCRMFDHKTNKSQSCFANLAHPLYNIFKEDKLTALVLAAE